MNDLVEFWNNNIEKNYFYFEKFGNLNIDFIIELEVLDEKEAIDIFKDLLEPRSTDSKIDNYNDNEDIEDIEFILISFYLNQKGYFIDKFPEFLERPTNRYDLSNKKIRERLLRANKELDGTVPWQLRREYIADLEFIRRWQNVFLEEDVKRAIEEVSLNKGNFNDKEDDEKLLLITNVIEYLLKDDKKQKFLNINYSECFELFNEKDIINYRKVLQDYRHSTKEAVKTRKNITENQKRFLINYGITIINYISSQL